jgi:hypothetical protein
LPLRHLARLWWFRQQRLHLPLSFLLPLRLHPRQLLWLRHRSPLPLQLLRRRRLLWHRRQLPLPLLLHRHLRRLFRRVRR